MISPYKYIKRILKDTKSKNSNFSSYQVLWHAGNIKPSETLKNEGRVYGFKTYQNALKWKKEKKKKKIYKIITSRWILDDSIYAKREGLEFIAGNVINEKEV